MNVSTQVALIEYADPSVGSPQPVFPPSDSSARLSEFTLTDRPPLRQLSLSSPNPFCRLTARSSLGAPVCDKGCGIDQSNGDPHHQCPLGMIMRRIPASSAEGRSRWVGRRFPNLSAMHQALDLLNREGVDEEIILAHLPPNPVVSPDELEQISFASAPGEYEYRLDVHPGGEGSDAQNMVEYIDQVQALLSTARKPSVASERLLRVLAGVVPFHHLSVYLRDDASGGPDAEPVLVASIDLDDSGFDALRPQSCRLEPGSLGAQAFHQGRNLIGREGEILGLESDPVLPQAVAMVLTADGRPPLGVLLAQRSDGRSTSRIQGDPLALMRLATNLLATRLDRIESIPFGPAPKEQLAPEPAHVTRQEDPVWGKDELIGALAAETARAGRSGRTLALLSLQAISHKGTVALPLAELTGGFRSLLRPYDQLAVATESTDTWNIILSEADESMARKVAGRLVTIAEDIMDAHGGVEEQGLAVGVGISIGGADATNENQMVEHAWAARAMSLGSNSLQPLQVYDSSPASAALPCADSG
jgi:hypothetical protein